ncbi:uncharacterized protein LOC101453272 [Ceratitis capitata]|uniref:uncharacterized protein LOC101453272 n=1 Tax=Ceratitis capitata TaxID=7213 RepID=UPI000329D000|nr:uncharacterized protein LOC101453272 [Ceratitis capitata]
MKLIQILLSCFLLRIYCVSASVQRINVGANLTDFMHVRKKRGLIFNGSGQLKLSIGPSGQVDLADPITWRSLVCSYSLQGGHYSIPSEPLYPWDKWEDTFARKSRLLHANRAELDANNYEADESRLFFYTLLETLMSRRGLHGQQCLLRSICQNAQVDQHVGLLSEILDVVLTPGREDLDKRYSAAREAGAAGADCMKLYDKCPAGVNFLDSYLEYI